MRSVLMAGAWLLTCTVSVYGCTTSDDDSNGGAGEGGAGGSVAGKGGSSSGSSGKAGKGGSSTSGSAGQQEGGGEAGTGVSEGGAANSSRGGTGGSGAHGGTGGSSKGGTGGSSTGGTDVTSAGQAGEQNLAGSDQGPGVTGPVPEGPCANNTVLGDVTWSEGFEGTADGWDITGGVWAIGAPTASDGPIPFEGGNVAGTVLGGDYGASEDAWLISPPIDVPAAKDNPRFAFRYWYELASGDTAYLYYRVGTGSWQSIASLSQSGDGAWHNMVFPLQGLANETVQFGFRLYTNASSFAPGFYIDDVRTLTGAEGMGSAECFESGWGEWSAYGGVWDIGKPTASDGPQPFDGEKLAGTILSGDYGASNDAWLVSPRIDVPAAKDNPRFSFKYWYDLASGDTGYVYLRVNGGSWQSIFNVTQSGDGSWRNLTFPLNAYADETVEFGFRLYTNASAFAPGFYVDDVHWDTGTPQFTAQQGFENGFDGWSAYGGVWAVGEPTATDGPKPHGGKGVAGTILSGNYGDSEDAWLVSPRIFVPEGATKSKASYWYWYNLAAGDTAYAYIRVDGGSWQSIDSLSAAADNTWRQHQVDLSTYANHTIELGFRLYTNASAYAPGFYIDDVVFDLK